MKKITVSFAALVLGIGMAQAKAEVDVIYLCHSYSETGYYLAEDVRLGRINPDMIETDGLDAMELEIVKEYQGAQHHPLLQFHAGSQAFSAAMLQHCLKNNHLIPAVGNTEP